MRAAKQKHTKALKLLIHNQIGMEQGDLMNMAKDLQSLNANERTTQQDRSKLAMTGISGGALIERLIQKEIVKCAQKLEIDQEELEAWLILQGAAPKKTLLALLRISNQMNLDPLKEEVVITQYEDGNWQAMITVEGWVKILNQHDSFNGITFNQSENLIEGIPEWMECTIYRKDRQMPITTREYLVEAKTEQEVWQKMPRRMLRIKSLQQCARLAIG
jgi:hypothetical protein